MSEITNNTTAQLTKVQNLQDVEVALQQIAETANESLAAALNAQIQVLKYVQSPKLYDSSFDLLFANVRKAIKMTDSSKEREMIREKSVVMINNYIFFMQAKIDYDTAVQRSEYEGLMKDAVLTLGESVTDIAIAASTAGTGAAAKAAMKKAVVDSVLKQKEKGDDGVFNKFMRWWAHASILQQKQGEFFETLYSLIVKLSKSKKLIGKSNIISGLIERYAKDIANHYTFDEALEIDAATEQNKDKIKRVFWGSISMCALVSGSVWMWREMSNAGTSFANLFRKAENEVALTEYSSLTYLYILGAFGVFILVHTILYFRRKKAIEKQTEQYISNYSRIYNDLLATAKAFEEGDEDYE